MRGDMEREGGFFQQPLSPVSSCLFCSRYFPSPFVRNGVPWVPEAFHKRFPVSSLQSALDKRLLLLVARENDLWYPGQRNASNRPFSSCLESHYESEASCIVFIMNISFHSFANKTYFHTKSCALSLAPPPTNQKP